MNIKDALRQMNLDGKKADIYLACLELGGATAYMIAKKIGLKRPTVYDVLDQLLKSGLVYTSARKKAKYFYPSDPEKLVTRIKEKERIAREAMPYLQNLYNSPKAKPFIRYFEGKEGIMEIYDDTLRTLKKGDELLAYVGEDVVVHLPEYVKDYVGRRAQKGVWLRGIYKKDKTILKYLEKDREQLRTSRVLDEKFFPMNNEINIYKNKVAILSYGKEMFGMIIESEEIARAQKAIFELAWKGAESLSVK